MCARNTHFLLYFSILVHLWLRVLWWWVYPVVMVVVVFHVISIAVTWLSIVLSYAGLRCQCKHWSFECLCVHTDSQASLTTWCKASVILKLVFTEWNRQKYKCISFGTCKTSSTFSVLTSTVEKMTQTPISNAWMDLVRHYISIPNLLWPYHATTSEQSTSCFLLTPAHDV